MSVDADNSTPNVSGYRRIDNYSHPVTIHERNGAFI